MDPRRTIIYMMAHFHRANLSPLLLNNDRSVTRSHIHGNQIREHTAGKMRTAIHLLTPCWHHQILVTGAGLHKRMCLAHRSLHYQGIFHEESGEEPEGLGG